MEYRMILSEVTSEYIKYVKNDKMLFRSIGCYVKNMWIIQASGEGNLILTHEFNLWLLVLLV